MATMILEAVVLASTLSLDAFLATFAYGSKGIKIPLSSAAVVSLVCSGVLGLSLLLGTLLRPYLAPGLSVLLSFLVLFTMGLIKLLDDLTKSLIRKHGALARDVRFSLLSFQFVLSVYADPEKADADHSQSLSPAEAASLALALSLDGLAVGFGAALGQSNLPSLLLASLLIEGVAVLLGGHVGNRLAARLQQRISWLSGVVLILLAFWKLLG